MTQFDEINTELLGKAVRALLHEHRILAAIDLIGQGNLEPSDFNLDILEAITSVDASCPEIPTGSTRVGVFAWLRRIDEGLAWLAESDSIQAK